MRNSSSRRRTTLRGATMAVILFGSAAAHALVASVVELMLPDQPPARAHTRAARAVEQPLTFSCVADAALAAAARVAVCASPFARSDECVDRARLDFELDRTRCHAVEIAVLDGPIEDRIRPEPLLPSIEPIDDVIAAELLEQEIAEKLEEAQKETVRIDPATGQIVEITRPQVEMAPDRARYLSEYDSRTERETVARGSTEEMVARPDPRELAPTDRASPLEELTVKPPSEQAEGPEGLIQGPPGPPGPPRPDSDGVMSMRGPGSGREVPVPGRDRLEPGPRDGPETITRDGIAERRGDDAIRSRRQPVLVPPGGDPEAGGGGRPRVPDLRFSEKTLDRAVGGGSVDKLDGVADGDETSLNSRQFRFAGFFNRMKRQVAQNWHPDVVYLRRDPTGKVYGTRDRVTILRVSLTPRGEVANIYVLKQSGVDFLDEEAVRAFREAQPFPNPPNGLVDRDSGLITFNFGFYFQIGDRRSWQLRWWRQE